MKTYIIPSVDVLLELPFLMSTENESGGTGQKGDSGDQWPSSPARRLYV